MLHKVIPICASAVWFVTSLLAFIGVCGAILLAYLPSLGFHLQFATLCLSLSGRLAV